MSGHSHWSSIKHQKGVEDLKKSQTFSAISRLISIAVQNGGPDPNGNPKLQAALNKAKAVNMPAKSIERAIQRSLNRKEGNLEEVTYEAFGPGKTLLIIEAITDNKNRTREQLRKILNQNNGKLAAVGSVKWNFDQKGLIHLPSSYTLTDTLELDFIEAGAEDIKEQDNHLVIYTKPQDIQQVVQSLTQQGYQVDSSTIGWVPKEYVTLSPAEKQKLTNLLDALGQADVQEVYTNVN